LTREFTRHVVREGEAGTTPAQAAREYPVHPTLIPRWCKEPLQDASQASTNLLKAHGIQISMRRTGNPDDHAQAERFIKTLTDEAVHLFAYQYFAEARERIGPSIAEVDHETRLHAVQGYRPPAEFERLLGPSCCASLVVSPQGFTPQLCWHLSMQG
jgi:hypothetical protein